MLSYICSQNREEEKFVLIATSDTEQIEYHKNAKAENSPLAFSAIFPIPKNLKIWLIYLRQSL